MHRLSVASHRRYNRSAKKVKEFTNQLCNLHKIFLCLKKAKIEF